MKKKRQAKLNSKKRYLQIAINGSLNDAFSIIRTLPVSDRIILEAGTPFIKRYGEQGIRRLKTWHSQRMSGNMVFDQEAQARKKHPLGGGLGGIIIEAIQQAQTAQNARATAGRMAGKFAPYLVADLKMMDRGDEEVQIAWRAGADAAVALGHAPIESLDSFIESCVELDLDSMIDMMNVEYPLAVLDKLKRQPDVIVLHRGVDESRFNKSKMLPLHEIRRIKGRYDVMISVAGGDTAREVQSAIFNDADIVVVWKDFYSSDDSTAKLAEEFLKQIK